MKWRLPSKTLGNTLARIGRLNGIVVTRTVLVVAIILFQSAEVSESFQRIFSTSLWIVPALALPALFTAMGFCWAMSRSALEPRAFLIARVRRSGPLILAVAVLTAFALGPLVTSETPGRYFSDAETWMYLANIVGWPLLTLPGVFEFNDLSRIVNTIVWMVPPFILLALIVAFAPAWRARLIYAILAVLVMIAPVAGDVSGVAPLPGAQIGTLITKSIFCLVGGLAGALAYSVRDHIPLDRRIVIGAGGWLIMIALAGNAGWSGASWLPAVSVIPMTMLVLHAITETWTIGRRAHRVQPYLMPALLLSFPVQQAAVALGPENQSLLTNAVLAFPAIMIAAFGLHQMLLRAHLLPLAAARNDDVPEAAWRKREMRRPPFHRRLRDSLLYLLLAIMAAAVAFAVLGLTYYALQRDAIGI